MRQPEGWKNNSTAAKQAFHALKRIFGAGFQKEQARHKLPSHWSRQNGLPPQQGCLFVARKGR